MAGTRANPDKTGLSRRKNWLAQQVEARSTERERVAREARGEEIYHAFVFAQPLRTRCFMGHAKIRLKISKEFW